MTEDRLRRWVLRQLPPEERREVTRWVVTCGDPQLGPLLAAMLAEARHSPLDAALAALGEGWRTLVGRWRAGLDTGAAATWSPAGPVLAAADGVAPWVEISLIGDRASIRIAPNVTAHVWLTSDGGRAAAIGSVASSTVVVPLAGLDRPVLWVVRDPPAAVDTNPLGALLAALAAPDARWVARRWDDLEG